MHRGRDRLQLLASDPLSPLGRSEAVAGRARRAYDGSWEARVLTPGRAKKPTIYLGAGELEQRLSVAADSVT